MIDDLAVWLLEQIAEDERRIEPFGHMPCLHLRLLAALYAGREGYLEEWRPTAPGPDALGA